MAVRKEKTVRSGEPAASDHRATDILALAFFAAGLIGLLSLATYHAEDGSFGAATGTHEVRNLIGPFGANLAWALYQVVGYVAWLLPVGLFASAVTKFKRRGSRLGFWRCIAIVLLLLSSAASLALALGSMLPADHFPAGGFIGRVLATGLVAALGTAGAWIVSVTLALASAIFLTKLSLKDAAAGASAATTKAAAAVKGAGRFATGLSSLVPRPAFAGAASELVDESADEEDEDEKPAPPAKAAREVKAASEKPVPRAAAIAAVSAAAQSAAEPVTAEKKSGLFHLKLRMHRPDGKAAETPAAVGAAAATAATATAAPRPAGPSMSMPTRAALPGSAAPAASASPTKPAIPAARPIAPRAAAALSRAQDPEATIPPPAGPPPPTRAKEQDAPAAAARSSESEFVAPAAREVAATSAADEPAPFVGARAQIARAVTKATATPRNFRLPPTKILDQPGEQFQMDENELMECAKQIVEKGAEFGVGGQVLHIHPGPVVTTYELKPDAGVKFSRICSLEDDLALALKAETIRIDRIPGKNTVGIEVPNKRREVISFRELAESDVFSESSSKITMILGKTIDGAPYVADLAKMPHLLIAGSTGSGKSVCLNSMITSILFKATPEEVKFIMVDPKMLELGMYKDIPHLLTPVVTNPKLASNALKWGVREMEQRYARLAGCGVRNIEQYNAWVKRKEEQDGSRPKMQDGSDHTPLPFIVIVIDELADLMMIAAADVEDSICRLAQMARAVGIHLILATQRPSVDVITGVIKANLPARIAMRVASKVDSRTILDSNGSEQLLGKGDMLFLPTGSSRLMRLHGPYLSETETSDVCDYLRTQLQPIYDEKVVEDVAGAMGAADGPGGPKDDELFDQAARIIVERGEASVSYLQRRLKVGYSRAARLVDMLEADGIVGPADGSKARDVLVGPDYFAEFDRSREATT